ncbi:MAG: type II toxin-antitoxin system VapC family toxin, partial [bacterium]|nr:type II toxin-antitoxin system VapC family toxin [bacterium]
EWLNHAGFSPVDVKHGLGTRGEGRSGRFSEAVAPNLLPFEAALIRSLHLVRVLGVSRTHDAAYMALALEEGCPLYTLDERFIRNAAWHGHPVRYPTRPDRPALPPLE